MRVLITGGMGFIGSAIVEALCRQNYEVIVYDMRTKNWRFNKSEFIKGDIFDAAHLADVLRGCDSVIHMVGLADARASQTDPQASFHLNIQSLQVLLEAMRKAGVSKVILPSSAAVYGVADGCPTEETAPKPASTYGWHKYIAEQLAEAYSLNYGFHITILRLFNVYGVNGSGILNLLLEKAKKGEPARLYGIEQQRDFIHVSDVADASVRAVGLDHKFEVYNVGTGVGRSIKDIVALVKDYYPNLNVQLDDYGGTLYDSIADIAKFRNATGFNPDNSDNKLRETIQELGKA